MTKQDLNDYYSSVHIREDAYQELVHDTLSRSPAHTPKLRTCLKYGVSFACLAVIAVSLTLVSFRGTGSVPSADPVVSETESPAEDIVGTGETAPAPDTDSLLPFCQDAAEAARLEYLQLVERYTHYKRTGGWSAVRFQEIADPMFTETPKRIWTFTYSPEKRDAVSQYFPEDSLAFSDEIQRLNDSSDGTFSNLEEVFDFSVYGTSSAPDDAREWLHRLFSGMTRISSMAMPQDMPEDENTVVIFEFSSVFAFTEFQPSQDRTMIAFSGYYIPVWPYHTAEKLCASFSDTWQAADSEDLWEPGNFYELTEEALN